MSFPSPDEARRIRKSAQISQVRLARALHVHPVTVWRWEHGQRRPVGWLRDAYREALEDLDEVVSEKNSRHPCDGVSRNED